MLKRWNVGNVNLGKVNRIREELGISSLLSKALVSLGYEEREEIEEFINPENLCYDPFMIPDMEKGAERVLMAVEIGEKIAVYGDYDADGITATAVVYSYLEGMGADVTYYIPERLSEGYGMNEEAIDRLYSEGVSLIITVDNGISSHSEIDYAKTKGIDVVVTDHHRVSDTLPDAYAVINPQREDCEEFKELAGVGVAFMLVCALEGDMESMLEFYSDLVSIGTLADVVPIINLNRIIVKKGIESMKCRSNAGISALLDICGASDINYQTVSFGVIPRINASGRMGSAETALRLIISEDEEEILSLAEEVDSLNRSRQETELRILDEAKELIETKKLSSSSVLIVAKEDWHQGVLGIVATRISELYAKPCILFSIKGDEAIGSGRSTGEMPLYDAVSECADELVRFGGHKFAAGMTIKTEKLESFSKRLQEYYKNHAIKAELPVLDICDVVSKDEITLEAVAELEYLKPFGNENPQPVFMLTGLVLEEIYSIGEGKHSRLKLTSNGNSFYVVSFGRTKESFAFSKNDRVDIAVVLEVNEYQGKKSVSYKLKGIRPEGFNDDIYERSVRFAAKIRNCLELSEEEKTLFKPTRDDFIKVYSKLSKDGFVGAIDELAYIADISYGKIYTAVTAFSELGLITIGKKGPNFVIKNNNKSGKVDLETAEIMKRF